MRGALRMQQAPAERSRDFRGSVGRLLRRLTPQRGLTLTVVVLAVLGIGIGVVGPRILGHATDLLFNGVIGRQLPTGLSKEQAIAAARDAGLGVVFITHNPHHAYLVGNHFIILKLGRVVLDAHRYELTLDQLCRNLGYAEQSVLTRSCKRWFGTTPTAYRNGRR